MTPEFVISFSTEALMVIIKLSAPVLIVALALGLIVSIFQAVTQIQEMTLAIIPKMGGVVLIIVVFFPWFLTTTADYMAKVFRNIPFYLGIG